MSLMPMLNFPAAIVSKDECEECRGTGYRMVARIDGAPGQVAVRCEHKIAAIAGRWQTVATWQDDFFSRVAFRRESRSPTAEQLGIDWAGKELERQKAKLAEWRREHAEELEEVLV